MGVKLVSEEAVNAVLATLSWSGVYNFVEQLEVWSRNLKQELGLKMAVYEDQGTVATLEEFTAKYGALLAGLLAAQPDTDAFEQRAPEVPEA